MNSSYPDVDCPWTFYFNGVEMPKWTSTWSLIPVDWTDDWIGDLCYRIYCRIDHLGNRETEDSELMRLCINLHLQALLEKKDEVNSIIIERLSDEEKKEPIIDNIFEGLNKMYELSSQHRVSFWTNGYCEDQKRLIDFMNIDHEIYPHEQQRKFEVITENSRVSKELRVLASSGRFPKSIRKVLAQK